VASTVLLVVHDLVEDKPRVLTGLAASLVWLRLVDHLTVATCNAGEHPLTRRSPSLRVGAEIRRYGELRV
jgi:hypothetical protein